MDFRECSLSKYETLTETYFIEVEIPRVAYFWKPFKSIPFKEGGKKPSKLTKTKKDLEFFTITIMDIDKFQFRLRKFKNSHLTFKSDKIKLVRHNELHKDYVGFL